MGFNKRGKSPVISVIDEEKKLKASSNKESQQHEVSDKDKDQNKKYLTFYFF